MQKSFARFSFVALAAAALTACGGGDGGGGTPSEGFVELGMSPSGNASVTAGGSLQLSSSAKAYFSAVDSHTWVVRPLASGVDPKLVTVSDPTCASATKTPGQPSSGGNPGINGASSCNVVLRVDPATPASDWEVATTAATAKGSASSSITVKVLPAPPQAQSGFNLSVPALPISAVADTLVSVRANASVKEGTQLEKPISYEWTQVSGPEAALAGRNIDTVTFKPKEAGDYVLGVKATVVVNGKTEVREGAVVVLVTAKTAPVTLDVNAGALQVAKVGDITTLSGVVTGSPKATVKWTQVGGPTDVALFNSESLKPQFTPTAVGDYVFEMQATHTGDVTVTKTARTKVSAYEPQVETPFFAVSAGDAQVAQRDKAVTMTATVEAGDPAPGNLTYAWKQTAGPTIALASPNALTASFVPTADGLYEFSFTATTAGAPLVSKTDTTLVHVLPATAQSFGLSVGNIQVAPVNEVVKLAATVSGANPADIQTRWVQTSGPGVQIFGQNSPNAEFRPNQAGEYQFEVSAWRAGFESAKKTETTSVTVYSTYDSPIQPVFAVSAGDAQIVGPNTPVVLQGEVLHGSPKAAVVEYNWVQLGGPNVDLSNPNTLRASFVPPYPELYTFLLTVTGGGVIKSSVTSVQVLAVPLEGN